MNYAGIQYSFKYRAVEIYLSGCREPHCHGCHNPETWDFTLGSPWGPQAIEYVNRLVSRHPRLVKNIWVLGGEPLDQPRRELQSLLEWASSLPLIKVWLFTGYELPDIPDFAFCPCSYIKTGAYDSRLTTPIYTSYGISLASSNQRVLCRGIDY